MINSRLSFSTTTSYQRSHTFIVSCPTGLSSGSDSTTNRLAVRHKLNRASWLKAIILLIPLLATSSTTAQQPVPAEGTESQLLAVLESDAELFDKAKACQRLAIIGTSDSVPVVAKLLADPGLSHYARTALESNPSGDVDLAFRSALGELEGAQLVGVINSVATRGDAKAADALIELASDADQDTASAAISALGALATSDAITTIKKALNASSPASITAADACLTAADRLMTQGKHADALDILKAVRSTELPKYLNVAARFGQIRAGSQNVNELMESYLGNDDPDLFRIGLELAHDLVDAKTTQQLVRQLDSLPQSRKVLLLHVLGERGDDSALPAVIDAAKTSDAGLTVAAIRVLGSLGDRSVVPVLLKASLSDNETLAGTARNSLASLQDPSVDALLAKRLEESKGKEKLVLVDVAGRRGIKRVIPLLLNYVSDEDAELRNSAIEGLGMTVGLKDFPPLLDKMLAMGSSESAKPMKEALRKACQRMGNRGAASKVLLDRMQGLSAAEQLEVMDLLIYVGGEAALEGVRAAAESGDPSSADAATQALGRWLTPDAAPVLLELAKSGNPDYRVRCLRGYIRIIRQFGLKPGKRLQMSKLAFAAATRDEERKLVLDTLTRFPLVQGLKMISPHLANAALREDASQAAVAIGEKLVDNEPKAVADIMPKVISATNREEISKRAKVLIERSR